MASPGPPASPPAPGPRCPSARQWTMVAVPGRRDQKTSLASLPRGEAPQALAASSPSFLLPRLPQAAMTLSAPQGRVDDSPVGGSPCITEDLNLFLHPWAPPQDACICSSLPAAVPQGPPLGAPARSLPTPAGAYPEPPDARADFVRKTPSADDHKQLIFSVIPHTTPPRPLQGQQSRLSKSKCSAPSSCLPAAPRPSTCLGSS